MERRKALRKMGLSLGYIVATPTLMRIAQSCKNESATGWTPEFFPKEEGAVITHLVDIILPKTDTPSASEVNTHIFIDKFSNEAMEKNQQDFVKMSMGRFMDKALKDSGKDRAVDLTPEDLRPVLAAALMVSKEEEAKNFETINSYQESVAHGNIANLDDVVARFGFANNLRGLTIWGYKISEYVGEEVLAYLPIPAEYIPCEDTQKLTGGKAWSL
ncbi:gluconate 2-dehydrogenase subunit 3 family protein [Flagellimonas sp.]|jgi:hypothetical protein|uniref:gluconate 2-dehydrogenase subunit 3 family protein n=1 Tax=Flagellimonas sp. TaxID=2058762 RepID=UPI003BAC5213